MSPSEDLTFPTDPTLLGSLQQPIQLFNLLASFYQNYLTDTELLQYHQFSKLQNHADVVLLSRAIEAAGSIQTITPFVARQWRLITLLESELIQAPNLIQYGDGRTYGDGLVYGQIAGNSFIWTIQEDIQDLGYVVDHVVTPAHIFDLSNSSYDPVTNQLKFAVNPFTLLNPAPVYNAAGVQTDRSISLFARNVAEDMNLPFLRYGSIVKVPGTSSWAYVKVLQAVWSMLVRGPSVQALEQGLLASAGLPYCVGNETVQVVQVDGEGLCIVTDQNVYRFGTNATPLVAVGDVLAAGENLVDTVQVFELGSGASADLSSLGGLTLGANLMNTQGELFFPNVDGTYTWTGSDAQFTLFGNPADIAAFWAGVAAKGVASGQTLAQRAGVSAFSGPVAVNPMTFLLDNVLGNNIVLILVKPEDFLLQEPGFLARVGSLVPAGTLLLTVVELNQVTDQYSLATSPNSAIVYNGIGAIPPEVVSTSGGNLVYSVGTPRLWIT